MTRLILACGVALAALAAPAAAQTSAPAAIAAKGPIYAQHLVDLIVARHPNVVVLAIHATPEGTTQNVIVASNIGRIGKVADPDDMRVIKTLKPNLAVNAKGDRYEVELPLYDASHRLLGALGTVFAYHPGADTAVMQAEATQIRDYLSRRISHAKNLTEPYVMDASISPDNYGQSLIDRTFDANPDVAIMALHVTPPGRPDTENEISASTIGRIGKRADDDDLEVIRTGVEKLELNETKDRFENEMALHDRQGHTIGALGVVFPYNATTDRAARSRQAHALLAQIESQFTSAAQLLAPTSGAPMADGAGERMPSPLRIVGHFDLPGYDGDFDHFAADVPGNRLFVAAEDHGTLEVFNLATGAHLKTIKGPIGTPHSIHLMPDLHKMLVTDTGKRMSSYFDMRSYAPLGPLKLVQGADSVGYDAPRHRLYIVTGGKDVPMADSWLEEVDPRTGREYSKIHFDANHVEAMAVEQRGPRLFINVTDKNYIAVIDKSRHAVVARWPVTAAEQNCCFALDEANHRLFVVTRKPGKLLVLDSVSGATLASFDAPSRVDQLLWDERHHRAYALGGQGYVTIVEERGPNAFVELPRLVTAPGAKTGIIVPERNEMFIAASPGDTKALASILRVDLGQ